ncbi:MULTISPECIES: hypothetical protein [Pseudomonas]|uniref:hypothetical protein n=1 Tax=Pseudomonas TaxID=286 RepID=UPI0008112A75|nr:MULTISPECIES: hypothetical protein [Pseudomonas]ATR81488.1 hypothetical protein CS390_02460 [Pseudomonas sp. HLS-6]MBP9961220.1 hypothetical protein [Pseudomonas sp.]
MVEALLKMARQMTGHNAENFRNAPWQDALIHWQCGHHEPVIALYGEPSSCDGMPITSAVIKFSVLPEQ